MCCLFGLIDYQNRLTAYQKNLLLTVLATASEARGTDATSISYSFRGRLHIYKRPCAGRYMHFHVPEEVQAVMGHTRMTTQGNCRRNYNNHPFPGKAGKTPFALAHNGILYNDGILRRKLALSRTRIETDSYIAVQLIEKKKTLTLDSLQFMAEQVRGSFTFTVQDEINNLYIIKGDSPLCLYHYPKPGLYIYCSTEEILQTALSGAGLRLEHPERVLLHYGDILQINPSGDMKWGQIHNDDEPNKCHKPYEWQEILSAPDEEPYLDTLKSVAGAFGFIPEEIDQLYQNGLALEEIEEAFYNGEI